jgi:hypothetical protein
MHPAVTDVAAEMGSLTDIFRDCKACHRACVAAVDMLAVRGFLFHLVKTLDSISDSIN